MDKVRGKYGSDAVGLGLTFSAQPKKEKASKDAPENGEELNPLGVADPSPNDFEQE